MAEKEIKKEEKEEEEMQVIESGEIEAKEESVFSPPEKDLDEVLRHRLFPRLTPMTGRQAKLRNDFNLSGVIDVSTTVTSVTGAANGTTETNLYTFTFNPQEWHIGMLVRLTAFGVYSTANATDTVTLRVGLGTAPTTEINSIVSTGASVTNVPWNLTWIGIITAIGSSGTIEAQFTGGINNVKKDDGNTATSSINTPTSQILSLTTP